MSQQIDTALVKQYHDSFERLLQQKGSRLRACTRMEGQNGEEQFWDQIGAVEAEEVSTRHGDSPQADTPHARRRVTLRSFDIGDFIDTFDKVKMLGDPSSTYVQNFADALNRKRDSVIKDAFFGTAYTGKAGATAVSTGWNVVNEDVGTANSVLTLAKLIKAREYLRAAQVDENEPLYFAMDAAGFSDLLGSTTITSADYNTVKALVQGQIDSFMGFKFIHYEPMGSLTGAGGGGATTVKRYAAWAKSGILHATGMDIRTRVTERADKRFSWYAYAAAMFGAVRMEELKVVEVQSFVA